MMLVVLAGCSRPQAIGPKPTATVTAGAKTAVAEITKERSLAPTADLTTPIIMETEQSTATLDLPLENVSVEPRSSDNTYIIGMPSGSSGYDVIITTPDGVEVSIRELGLVGWVGGDAMEKNRYSVTINGIGTLYDMASGTVPGGITVVSKGYAILDGPGYQIRYKKIQ